MVSFRFRLLECQKRLPQVYSTFQASTAKLVNSVLFWVITQRVVLIYYRRFRTTYRSKIQGPRSQSYLETSYGITTLHCVISQKCTGIIASLAGWPLQSVLDAVENKQNSALSKIETWIWSRSASTLVTIPAYLAQRFHTHRTYFTSP